MKNLPKVGDVVKVKKCINRSNAFWADVVAGTTYTVLDTNTEYGGVLLAVSKECTQWVHISEIKKIK